MSHHMERGKETKVLSS